MGRRVDVDPEGESAQLQAWRSKRKKSKSGVSKKFRTQSEKAFQQQWRRREAKRRRLEAHEERKSKAAEVRRMIDRLRDTM
jgi:hypothetical protein